MAVLGRKHSSFLFSITNKLENRKKVFTAKDLGLRKYLEKNHSPVRDRQQIFFVMLTDFVDCPFT